MAELLEEHVPRVYRFALRLARDPLTAEELTQEAFLRAWSRRAKLREPAAAKVWLFRIVRNLWTDQLRRRRFKAARTEALPPEQPARSPTPAGLAEDREELERTLAALDELPPLQREALYLRACEGLSAMEIAAVLETTPESVRSSLSLARRKLRERLPGAVAADVDE